MITNALIGLVLVILAPINAVVPAFHIPSFITGIQVSDTVAGQIGGPLGAVKNLLPIDTILTLLQAVLSLWGVIAVFLVFTWIWKHIPTIAGFGTGDG